MAAGLGVGGGGRGTGGGMSPELAGEIIGPRSTFSWFGPRLVFRGAHAIILIARLDVPFGSWSS